MNEREQEMERGRILAKQYPDYVKAFRAEVEAAGDDADGAEIFAKLPDPPVEMTEARAWALVTYLHEEIEREQKTTATAPRGTKTRGDRRLVDFMPDNSDEEWFHCKSPFLRFAVSNQRRVAWLVTVGHGAKSGKILKSRSRLVWLKGKPLAVHSVRLQDDTRKQREMNVEWLFENAAGRPKVRKSSADEVEVR